MPSENRDCGTPNKTASGAAAALDVCGVATGEWMPGSSWMSFYDDEIDAHGAARWVSDVVLFAVVEARGTRFVSALVPSPNEKAVFTRAVSFWIDRVPSEDSMSPGGSLGEFWHRGSVWRPATLSPTTIHEMTIFATRHLTVLQIGELARQAASGGA